MWSFPCDLLNVTDLSNQLNVLFNYTQIEILSWISCLLFTVIYIRLHVYFGIEIIKSIYSCFVCYVLLCSLLLLVKKHLENGKSIDRLSLQCICVFKMYSSFFGGGVAKRSRKFSITHFIRSNCKTLTWIEDEQLLQKLVFVAIFGILLFIKKFCENFLYLLNPITSKYCLDSMNIRIKLNGKKTIM